MQVLDYFCNMKKILKYLLPIIGMIFLVVPAQGARNEMSVLLSKVAYDNNDDEKVHQKGHRSLACPITAIVSQSDGMMIPGVDQSEIIAYEAYDEKGRCLGSFRDGKDFVIFLFAQRGYIEIRVELSDYYLRGYLEL